MIITQDKKKVVQSHDFDEVNCTIDAEDMRYVASLLRNNYSNTSLAVIREITANAVDANIEANAKQKVEVKLPTSMNTSFCVRDYGSGLSQGDVFGLYSKYGKSTKRTSNSYIGAFGIGKFAPLSYGDNFSVVSYYGGERKTYNVYVTEQDDTKISLMESVPTKEPTGLEVQVAIADSDIHKFRRECLRFFEHFEDNRMPILSGLGDDELNPLKKSLEGSGWFLAETDSSNHYQSHHNSHAIMGGVAYPINAHSINLDDVEENKNNHLFNLLAHDGLYINFDLGELKLHHSRESLEYNKSTQKTLIEKVAKIKNELSEIAKEKLAGADDFWEAKKNYARIINALPYQIRGVLESHFTWKGHKVDSFAFNQVWEDGHRQWRSGKNGDADMYINHYKKITDSDVSDGFKVQNTRESTIYVKDGALVALNDCDNSAQLALRIRTILKENPDATEVYVLRFTTKSIKKKFYDEQQFKLVDKNFVFSLRKVEKAKVKGRMGGGSSGTGFTRSNVKLFEFNKDKVHHRGAGVAWDDVSESPEDEALYVPIFNYKIVDKNSTGNASSTEEKITLSKLKHSIEALEQHKIKVPTIYGVRRKDCSKLEDNFKCAMQWIISKAEEVLKDDKIYERGALLESLRERRQWTNFYEFERCLDHQGLKQHLKHELNRNHKFFKFSEYIQKEDKLEIEVSKFTGLIGLVEEFTGESTYSEKMKAKKDSSELKKMFIEIKESYPMLQEIQIYGYGGNIEQYGRITEYIKLCDSVETS